MTTPDTEREVMQDAFKFLRDYSDCPPMTSEDSERYWKKVSERMTNVLQKYEGTTCKLAEKMCISIFEYLEYKSWLLTAMKDKVTVSKAEYEEFRRWQEEKKK